MIKISIIIPVFNVENYIERCLNSLINQTLKEIEIICINDGSTDNSLNILHKYQKKDCRITIINHKNRGIGYVRNEGVKIAKGEFLGFVDPDDWVDLNYFEKLYTTALQHNADIAVSGFIRLNKKKSHTLLKFKQEIETMDINEKILLCDVPDQNYLWNKIYKLKTFKEQNIIFPSLTAYEDIPATIEILYKLQKLVTVPNISYYYWKRNGSLVTQKDKKQEYKRAENMVKIFCNKHKINLDKNRTEIKKFKIFGITIFKTITKQNKKEFIILNFIKIK